MNRSVIDNSFYKVYDLSQPIPFKDSTDGIRIPLLFNESNEIVCMELGTADAGHTMITGCCGSGKTNMLYAIIMGIILNYHPDDVNIWLAGGNEYEFKVFKDLQLASVKITDTDDHCVNAKSVAGSVVEFFEKRKEEFIKTGVCTITEYKQKYGARSMPRIVLIVDELYYFMANSKISNLQLMQWLHKYEALGLTCVFTTQSVKSIFNVVTGDTLLHIPRWYALRCTLNDQPFALNTVAQISSMAKTLSLGEVLYANTQILRRQNTIDCVHSYLSVHITPQNITDVQNYCRNFLASL